MNLKKQITKLIEKSELSNKEVVAILDEIRTEYHDRKNVGTKGVSSKELSPKFIAEINATFHPISKDKKYVFYKGGWKKVNGVVNSRSLTYLGTEIQVLFRRK